MMRFYRTPWIIKKLYPSLIWRIKSNDSVFLTFDDGPHPETTDWIHDELEKYSARATFFYTGENVAKYPELVKQTMSKGHRIGNHTYSHLKGWVTNNEAYLSDIRACEDELNKMGIYNDLFRPPYGRIKTTQIRALKNKQKIMWSGLSFDYDSRLNLNRSFEQLKKSRPGDILVFHENKRAFKNLRILLPQVLEFFASKKYKFEAIHD